MWLLPCSNEMFDCDREVDDHMGEGIGEAMHSTRAQPLPPECTRKFVKNECHIARSFFAQYGGI